MSKLSVLLIGAGGAFGAPLLEEFIKQKDSFKRVAILARDENHASKFSHAKERGIAVSLGPLLDAASYSGEINADSLTAALSTLTYTQGLMSCYL